MYFYLYDTFVSDKKYATTLVRIETRLIDLGIQGIIERCSILKNMEELILHGMKRGAKNIIAVGDDSTFSKVLAVVAHKNVTLGFIPVGPKSAFAKALGIPLNEKACDVLSKRVVEWVDLGKVGKHYFFTSLRIPSARVSLECDDRYRISVQNHCRSVSICNLGHITSEAFVQPAALYSLCDGFLDAVIDYEPVSNSWFSRRQGTGSVRRSVIPLKHVRIVSQDTPAEVIVDEQIKLKTPVTVEVAPKKLPLIVGKDRLFR